MLFGKNKNRKVRTGSGHAFRAGIMLKKIGKGFVDKKRKTILNR